MVPDSEDRCARRCGSEGAGCRAVSGGISMGGLLWPRLMTGMFGGRADDGKEVKMWAESVDDSGQRN